MIRRLTSLIYGSEPAEFHSAYSMETSVARLTALRGSMIDTVKPEKVRLQRETPHMRNSFNPLFIGAFEQRGDEVVLTGKFTMHWLVKVFLTYSFCFCAVWVAIAAYIVAVEKPELWYFPLGGLAMFGLLFGFVKWGKRLARGNTQALSAAIEEALS
mgnify:CR=1 FL=1